MYMETFCIFWGRYSMLSTLWKHLALSPSYMPCVSIVRVLVESQLESQLLHHVWSGVIILPLGRPVFGRKGSKCMLLLI